MIRLRPIVLLVALAIASMAAHSSGLESKGQPDSNIAPLGTYGMAVPTKSAMKSLVPPGWKVYVHNTAKLPESVDWSLQDTWPQVLKKMAATTDLSVLLDWDTKSVLVRTADVAVQENATRQEIKQAAVTPLPKFEPAAKQVPAPIAATEVVAEVKPVVAPAAELEAPKAEPIAVAIAAPSTADVPAEKVAQAEPAVAAAPLVAAPSQEPQTKAPSAETAVPVPAPSTAPTQLVATVETPAAQRAPDAFLAATIKKQAAQSPVAPQPLAEATRGSSQLLAAFFGATAAQDAPVTPKELAPVEPAKSVSVATPVAPAPAVESAPRSFVQAAAPGAGAKTPAAAAAAAAAAEHLQNPFSLETAKIAPLVAPAPVASTPARATPDVESGVVASAIALPVIRNNPSKEMVERTELVLAQQPAKLQSTAEFSYNQAVAYNKPALKKTLQAIAGKYKLRLIWAYPEDIALKGPVTLLAQDVDQDLQLLQKALGRGVPVEFEASDGLLKVFKKGSSVPVALPFDGLSTAKPATIADVYSPEGISTTNRAIEPRAVAAPLRLDIQKGQALEDAIFAFAKTQGYTLEWAVKGGFEANRLYSYEGATVAQVLSQVLPPLMLSADVYTTDKHINIRPGDSRY